MKSMQRLIPLEAPYTELSFDRLAEHVRAMEIFTDVLCKGERYAYPCPSSCPEDIWRAKIKKDMENLIEKVQERLCGLDLDMVNNE